MEKILSCSWIAIDIIILYNHRVLHITYYVLYTHITECYSAMKIIKCCLCSKTDTPVKHYVQWSNSV